MNGSSRYARPHLCLWSTSEFCQIWNLTGELVTDTLYQERHREQEREEKDQERGNFFAECDPSPRKEKERVEPDRESTEAGLADGAPESADGAGLWAEKSDMSLYCSAQGNMSSTASRKLEACEPLCPLADGGLVDGREESRPEENSPTCRRTGTKYVLI